MFFIYLVEIIEIYNRIKNKRIKSIKKAIIANHSYLRSSTDKL